MTDFRFLKVDYTVWKEIFTSSSFKAYKNDDGPLSRTVWTGNPDFVFEAYVDSAHFPDYTGSFGDAHTHVSSAHDAIAHIIGTSSIPDLRTDDGVPIFSIIDVVAVTGSVALSEAIPLGDNKIGRVSVTDVSGSNQVAVVFDPEDNVYRFATTGKVSVTVAPPPAGGSAIAYAADTPLVVSNTEDSDFVLPDGKTLHIQQVVAGAAGDPSEKGSVVEIYYVDASSVEHLVDRIYTAGFTEFGNYPDTSITRDGTELLGDTSGTDTLIRIRRRRIAGASAEIDAVVRGYTI